MCIHKHTKEEGLKQEDCLYQVVDRSINGVFLQNLKDNKVYEEKDMSPELLSKIGNDYILRYKEGEYIFEEELTDKFMERINRYK